MFRVFTFLAIIAATPGLAFDSKVRCQSDLSKQIQRFDFERFADGELVSALTAAAIPEDSLSEIEADIVRLAALRTKVVETLMSVCQAAPSAE